METLLSYKVKTPFLSSHFPLVTESLTKRIDIPNFFDNEDIVTPSSLTPGKERYLMLLIQTLKIQESK